MLGGDLFRDALIDLSQRGRHNVELVLAGRWFFALSSHASPAIKRILGLLRRDTELSVEAIPVEHCHLAQLIAGPVNVNGRAPFAHSILAQKRDSGHHWVWLDERGDDLVMVELDPEDCAAVALPLLGLADDHLLSVE